MKAANFPDTLQVCIADCPPPSFEAYPTVGSAMKDREDEETCIVAEYKLAEIRTYRRGPIRILANRATALSSSVPEHTGEAGERASLSIPTKGGRCEQSDR